MTFTSEEMIAAAKESIWNYPTITEKEQGIAREFFYRGSLWSASKTEERECKIEYIGNGNRCGNCGQYIGKYFNFCDKCGYKFIKEGE